MASMNSKYSSILSSSSKTYSSNALTRKLEKKNTS